MSAQKEEEKNDKRNEKKNEEKDEESNKEIKNEDKEKSEDNNIINDNFENILGKEDINFDSIDFNINPFNSDIPEKKVKDNESEDLVLEEKEDDNFEVNKIQMNQKYHTSNDLLKVNYFSEDKSKEKEKDKNKEIFNINNKINSRVNNNNINNNINYNNNNLDNISHINNNFINFNLNNNFPFNENYNNSKKIFNNSNNINFDLEANSFIPRNSNNNNNDNNNDFFSNKIRQSWICSFCHNLNYQSKKYILFKYLLYFYL